MPPIQETTAVSQGTKEFASRLETVKALLPEGFIPNHPPDCFSKCITSLMAHKDGNRIGEPGETVTINPAIRPEYDRHISNSEIKQIDQEYPNLLVFNQQNGPEGYPQPISLNDENYKELKQLAKEYLRFQTGDCIIAGFAGEASSVRGCLEAAIDYVGPNRVIAVDAGYDPLATDEAKKAGCKVINQKEVLEKLVNWDQMKKQFNLPFTAEKPPCGKGTTYWVAMLYLEAIGLLKEGDFVTNKDTDVINPYIYVPELYMALARMYHPENNPVEFTQALRTGQGRNNEPWLYQVNALVNAKTFEKRLLGYALGPITWPLSDARSAMWRHAREMPTTTSMGMETIRNVCSAGLSLERGLRLTAQVVVPDQKIENAESPPDREFRVVFHCAQLLRDLAEMTKTLHRFPHQWTHENIASFNDTFGGRITDTFIPPRHQGANILDQTMQEYILPSIKQLREFGDDIINWEKLKKL